MLGLIKKKKKKGERERERERESAHLLSSDVCECQRVVRLLWTDVEKRCTSFQLAVT